MLKLALFFISGLTSILSDQGPKATIISGHIKTNKDSVKLELLIFDNYITPSVSVIRSIPVRTDKSGNFFVKLNIQEPTRVILQDLSTYNALFENPQFIQPGDSIFLKGTIFDQPDPSPENFVARYSGKGHEKWDCLENMKKVIDHSSSSTLIPFKEKLKTNDSIINEKIKILSRYKTKIDKKIYDAIFLDLIGDNRNRLMMGAFEPVMHGEEKRKEDTLNKFIMEKKWDIDKYTDNDTHLFTSYIDYLYYLNKVKLSFKSSPVLFKDYYNEIKSSYNSLIREKILLHLFTNNGAFLEFFNGADPVEYTNCLEDAVNITQTPWIKQKLQTLLSAKGKGALPLDFSLPVDSSQSRLNLSSLKGKVVLLDMWAINCTGCYRFSNAFHEKIYPLFKDNKDFKVVSVLLDNSNREKYLDVLRGKNKRTYTYGDYINLFGGKGEETIKDTIMQHYGISGFPFLLLVDKRGRIYSSTIHFFTRSDDSQNITKLTSLINKALSE